MMLENWGLIGQNLLIMAVLAPVMFTVWWFFVKYLNRKLGYDLKEIYDKIYSTPMSSAVMRIGTMYVIAQLVIAAFGRLV